MYMASMSPDKGSNITSAIETVPSSTAQPLATSAKLADFLLGLESISESSSTAVGEDIPASGGMGGAMTTQGQTSGVSPRDQAIANLPAPAVMQREISRHIKGEIKKLRKEARRVARVNEPGGAYHLVMLYSKMHRLNALLKEIYEAGLDVLKRLYVRIFVDRQTI